MRHIVIYKVLYECDAPNSAHAIEAMQLATGVTYDVVDHCIMNVPCDTLPVTWHGALFQ